MTPITIWKMRYKRKDEPETWEHNHIENGYSHGEFPKAHYEWQEYKWSGQKWRREYGYLIDGKIERTPYEQR